MYELFDDCTTMFFYRNKHIMVDLGTGNNNKINWALADKQEMIDIIEMVYRGARKGRGLVVSPKDYSTKYRYWKWVCTDDGDARVFGSSRKSARLDDLFELNLFSPSMIQIVMYKL